MKQVNVKKLILPNIPYVFIALLATKVSEAVRLAPGSDASTKLLNIMTGLNTAFHSLVPSFHPIDLCVGVAAAIAIRLAVYIKGKNAKKFRKNLEYGSARWGTAEDIKPYVDPAFENNIILTQTERLTMNSRPKDPKTARNKNVLIVGSAGSGKSTLAKHFNAILLPTGGKVYVDGMDTSDENNLLSVRATVGMVFQNPDNQIVANVVEDDVAFAPENLGVPPQEIRARVDAALKQVGMYDFRLHAPHLLSGGQKQRVAIAGVIAMQPKCIVLDEPTAMLDPAGRREVIDTATKLCREQGITVVLITHHMEECIGADRVIVLSNGAVVADGAPKQVFSQVDLLKREGLTAPVTVRLLHALRAHGMDVPLDALTVSDCADAVAAALKP